LNNRETPKHSSANSQRWQRIVEILSATALLLTIIGIGSFLTGFLLYIWVSELRTFANWLMFLSAALFIIAALSSLVPIKQFLSGHRGRYAINALAMLFAAIFITILVNYLGFKGTVRYDLTSTRQFSLSAQTLQIVNDLKEPVHAIAFFIPDKSDEIIERQRAEDLLSEYKNQSNGLISFQFKDPDSDPAFAKAKGVSWFPLILFEAKDSGERYSLPVPPVAEQDITSALLAVTGTERKMIYFLRGHGEKSPSEIQENDDNAIGMAVRGVLADGYGVGELNLSQKGAVPDDTAVLVIAGPKSNILRQESEILSNWLNNGGRALFMLDPKTPESFIKVLEPWGISAGVGTIVDRGSSLYEAPKNPIIQPRQYSEDSYITSFLDATLLPEASPVFVVVDPKKQPPWIDYTSLANSSIGSWVTLDEERLDYAPELDVFGPHSIGYSVEAASIVNVEPVDELSSTLIVVIGDSDFASNKYYSYSSNKDLFINSVNWLAQDYDLISIRPKIFSFRHLVLTRFEYNFIRYSSWFLLPTIVALAGLLTWWRRR
jgi:hypothetical protein